MTATTLERPSRGGARTGGGGIPARRAVMRWALRMFRREWRQQLLMLGMLIIAVAATVIGAGVATNTPPPATAGFGTATASVTIPGGDPRLAADISSLRSRYGAVDVIEDQAISTGSAQQASLRAQDPHGPYDQPLLKLDGGSYPTGAGQVALTQGLASLYSVHVGGTWRQDGQSYRVTGIVENPTNLLDEFALVAPGKLTSPAQVTVLLDAQPPGQGPGSNANPGTLPGLPQGAVAAFAGHSTGGSLSPAAIVLAISVMGMVFVGLVAAAGFTVIGQRRLRALGMISALGATERNVRLVTTANGAFVGIAAAVAGAGLGLAGWLGYAPHLATATGHRISATNLPWWAIGLAMALAVATSVLAARRPAKNIARVPVVRALAGRPAEPSAVHRSILPGLLFLAAGLTCLFFSGGWGGTGGTDTLFLLGGLIGVVVGIFKFAPVCIAVLAAAGPRVTVSVRIALRDLVRYRARSGAALAAVTFATFLAMLICVIASVRFSNVLDYTGQNLTSSQLAFYTSAQGQMASGQALTQHQEAGVEQQMGNWASSVHATSVLPLADAGATLNQIGRDNNNFSGPLYVATPQLLAQYGINDVNPDADILSMRPGFSSEPSMQLAYGTLGDPNKPPTTANNPVIQEVTGLPSGTSAPNTVITQHALAKYGLREHLDGWLITTPQPLTTQQISQARAIAAQDGVSIESKSGELDLGQIANGATILGLLIALGVLAMSAGLIRSETARDLRTLTATGASSITRRIITAATVGALGLLGAVLGAAGAMIAGLTWAHSSLTTTFGHVPVLDYLLLLVALPTAAAAGGWLLAGRDPATIARQPME
jgi:putative ABC transport system permease protein